MHDGGWGGRQKGNDADRKYPGTKIGKMADGALRYKQVNTEHTFKRRAGCITKLCLADLETNDCEVTI